MFTFFGAEIHKSLTAENVGKPHSSYGPHMFITGIDYKKNIKVYLQSFKLLEESSGWGGNKKIYKVPQETADLLLGRRNTSCQTFTASFRMRSLSLEYDLYGKRLKAKYKIQGRDYEIGEDDGEEEDDDDDDEEEEEDDDDEDEEEEEDDDDEEKEKE